MHTNTPEGKLVFQNSDLNAADTSPPSEGERMGGLSKEEAIALLENQGREAEQAAAAKGVYLDGLPLIVPARELVARKLPLPSLLIKGLLYQGGKMVLAGSSKSFKTWSLMDLAISVAGGQPWWGLETTKGKTLYVDFEIQKEFFAERVARIVHAKGLEVAPEDLDVWTLRGYSTDFSKLFPRLTGRIEGNNYSLIVIDPIYKGLGTRDENNASSIGSLLNEIEKLAVATGAAVVFGAHFSKGNQSGKDPMDRISGSGVFARDPDALLIMTRHQDEDTYVVQTELRNFPRMPEFGVRWDCPLMRRDDEINTKLLKQANLKTEIHSAESLLEVLGNERLTTKDWKERTMGKTKMGESTFHEKKRLLKSHGRVTETDGVWHRITPDLEKLEAAANPAEDVPKAA